MAIPNIHQSIDEIIKTSQPGERLLWQQLRLLTGENAAVQQLVYTGVTAGSEFLTYSANKLYFALDVKFGYGSVNVTPGGGNVVLYDINNLIHLYLMNMTALWNATTAVPNYNPLNINEKLIYFSRFTTTGYNYFQFIGFKLIF